MLGSTSQEVMPGGASGEVMLLRRKTLKSTVNGPPSSDKSMAPFLEEREEERGRERKRGRDASSGSRVSGLGYRKNGRKWDGTDVRRFVSPGFSQRFYRSDLADRFVRFRTAPTVFTGRCSKRLLLFQIFCMFRFFQSATLMQ